MKLMVMIEGPMINKFIEDSEEFNKFAEEKFKSINQSQEEKVAESMAMDGEESNDDRFTAVDLESYKSQLKEMMTAVAQGIGNTPVNVLVDEGSLLLKINEFEIARIRKEEEEFEEMMKKKKIEDEEEKKQREINNNSNNNNILISPKKERIELEGAKKIKKKKFDILNLTCCSVKQFIEN